MADASPAVFAYTRQMATKRKKRKKRRRGSAPSKKGGGVMFGMRSGFKDVANSVTGKKTKGKFSWLGTLIVVVLLGAAMLMLIRNFG